MKTQPRSPICARTIAMIGLFLAATTATSLAAQPNLSPEARAEAESLAQLCRADYYRVCNGVQPGGGRIVACLTANADALSPKCRAALPRAEDLKNQVLGASN